jgi:hypothetical protein
LLMLEDACFTSVWVWRESSITFAVLPSSNDHVLERCKFLVRMTWHVRLSLIQDGDPDGGRCRGGSSVEALLSWSFSLLDCLVISGVLSLLLFVPLHFVANWEISFRRDLVRYILFTTSVCLK